jgi:tRNA (guanine-N7-)-methyltransferase
VSIRNRVKLPLEALQPHVFTLPEPGQFLDFLSLFGNNHPIELEVGFGKGAFLVEAGPAHPERSFLGIEIDKGLQLYVAGRLARRKIPNVKVAQGDAGRLLTQHLPDACLDVLHVYFPDPWWKKKHRKRRVFNEAFAQQAARVLKPGGLFKIATDVAEYFQVMLGIMTEHPEFTALQGGREERVKTPAQPMTNFEKKARNVGRPVWRVDFVREGQEGKED